MEKRHIKRDQVKQTGSKLEPAIGSGVTPIAVVFCDDIRLEVTGKEMLLGVYNSNITVRSVPVMLPVSVWIQIKMTAVGGHPLRIKVTDPAGNTAGQVSMEVVADQVPSTGSIPLPPLVVNIAAPGEICVHWSVGDSPFEIIAEKTVMVGEVRERFPMQRESAPRAS